MKRSKDSRKPPIVDDHSTIDTPSPPAYPGAKRGFGGGRYAAPYSGSYGGEFRDDYRASRSDDSRRFPEIKGDSVDDDKPRKP